MDSGRRRLPVADGLTAAAAVMIDAVHIPGVAASVGRTLWNVRVDPASAADALGGGSGAGVARVRFDLPLPFSLSSPLPSRVISALRALLQRSTSADVKSTYTRIGDGPGEGSSHIAVHRPIMATMALVCTL